jgi:hypothetical protein
MPTQTEILKLQTNIINMQSFNDHVYNYGNAKIANAFALLSQTDNTDLGNKISVDLLSGACYAITGLIEPIGTVAGSFLSSYVSGYYAAPPPSLNMAFSNLINRFQATSIQLDYDLAQIYSNPLTYWNNTYSGTINTPFGSYPVSSTVSQLSTIDFPAETDPQFDVLVKAAVYALDQQIWDDLLQRFIITKQTPEVDVTNQYDPDGIDVWLEEFYNLHKAYWCTYTYYEDISKKGKDNSYWRVFEYNIGSGVNNHSDGSLNDNACNYLFIDSIDNVIINPDGLFHRTFVFNNLGIRTTTK